MFFLNEFDNVRDEDIPKPSKAYFQSLKYVKYQDKTTKTMYQDLGQLIGFTMRYYLSGRLGGWESNLLKTLTYCSAVSDGREIIVRDDIVNAFNTYFKLLKTDVTKYKAIPERIIGLENRGAYLVCEKCGTYYQIPEGANQPMIIPMNANAAGN